MREAIASVCKNGHICSGDNEELTERFCSKCGEALISSCPTCKAIIPGNTYFDDEPEITAFPIFMTQEDVPSYCTSCGNAFPWTSTAIEAAQELIDLEDKFSPEEKDLLKQDIIDLTKDSPKQKVACLRIKKLAKKAGKVFMDTLHEVIVNVVSEAVRKSLWG